MPTFNYAPMREGSAEEAVNERIMLTPEEKTQILAKSWKEEGDFIKNLAVIPKQKHEEVAMLLIQNGKPVSVARNLEHFGVIDYNAIARLLINTKGGPRAVAINIQNFSHIDKDIVDMVVSLVPRNVANNMDHFPIQYRESLMRKLIEEGDVEWIGMNLKKFPEADHLKIASMLIEKDAASYIDANLEQFKVDPSQLVRLFLKRNPNTQEFISRLKQNKLWKEEFSGSFQICFAVSQMAENSDSSITVLEAHHFLKDAFVSNPRDAIRLVLSFPDFDELSQENIAKLYELKKISNIDPNQNPDAYRDFMQKGLLGYRNNKNILYDMTQKGVLMDTYLNYEQKDDFTLGKEQDVPLSEKVNIPMKRIQETLDAYNTVFKEALVQYKHEFSAHRVSLEDETSLGEQLSAMQKALEQARVEGDEKKIQGIERGIAGMRNRLENPKMVSLWDKLVGDYDIVMRLQKDLIEVNAKIRQAEDGERMASAAELTTPERRTQIQAAKAQREHLEASFRDKLEKMDARFTAFQEKLPQMLASGISEERAEALVQEVQMSTSEQIGHYQSDISTLKDILSDDEEKENLEGRSMSIELWNRDPDIDLYLGNYTSCCVSIDNDVHGSESPISDYLTDIGIQVITITDQKRKRPIAAAWCYVGIDKGKNIALVIDNVEADTKYSVPFQSQLENKLHEYIQAYADAAGIKIVSQGPANNDLVVANLEEKYMKLGGYNRPSGYFLEAEPDDDEGEYGDEY